MMSIKNRSFFIQIPLNLFLYLTFFHKGVMCPVRASTPSNIYDTVKIL